MSLTLSPINLDEANAFVELHHRHRGAVVGAKFCIGVSCEITPGGWLEVVGVAIVGRPIARHMDDGWTLEVNRLCTIGERNACSMLYSACWRAARALGYSKLITYTMTSENGASLRAAGWKVVGEVRGRSCLLLRGLMP